MTRHEVYFLASTLLCEAIDGRGDTRMPKAALAWLHRSAVHFHWMTGEKAAEEAHHFTTEDAARSALRAAAKMPKLHHTPMAHATRLLRMEEETSVTVSILRA